MSAADFNHTSFQSKLTERKLMGARCQSCDALYLPPRPYCPACHGEELGWIEFSGRGELLAYTTVHIAPTAMIEAGYSRKNPYCTGVVRLEEGPAISAQILGVDSSKPETIKVGTPVKAEFVERGEGESMETFLAFRAI